jgi:hypothetical protein
MPAPASLQDLPAAADVAAAASRLDPAAAAAASSKDLAAAAAALQGSLQAHAQEACLVSIGCWAQAAGCDALAAFAAAAAAAGVRPPAAAAQPATQAPVGGQQNALLHVLCSHARLECGACHQGLTYQLLLLLLLVVLWLLFLALQVDGGCAQLLLLHVVCAAAHPVEGPAASLGAAELSLHGHHLQVST